MFFGSWRDESYYDYTANHDLIDWAWEFIRRNPKYQQFVKSPPISDENILLLAGKEFGFTALILPESDDTYCFRLGFEPLFSESFLDWAKSNKQVTVIFDLSKDIASQTNTAKLKLMDMQKEMGLALPNAKQRKGDWKLYLRVLDADNSGTKRKESAKILYPRLDNAASKYSDALHRARVLSKSGYKKLLEAAGCKLYEVPKSS